MSNSDPRYEDLLSLVVRQADRFEDKTLITFGDGQSMSFRSFERRIAGFRRHLSEIEIGPGDRVALMMKNSLFYPVAWLGVVSAGAVAVPVNSRLGESDTRYLLELSRAVGLIVDDSTSEVARAAAPDAVRTVIEARGLDPMAEFETDGDVPAAELHAGSIANIQFSSGTTGFPKGCLLAHRYWQRMGAAATELMRLDENETLLTSQPHSYVDPQWNLIAALRAGCHLVLLDAFHPSTFMRDVVRFDVTTFYCLGVMPTLLSKQPPATTDRDNKLKRVYCSAIPVEHHAAIEERWGAPWFEAFGMTETGINTAVADEDHDRLVGSACIGRPLWHNEASVVDENDVELGAGVIGEMVLRGLGFMEGYLDDPETTAEMFRNGWFHTGDLVERDEDGYLFYRGRRKEIIRRGGENISPVEIETALSTHEGVMECAIAPVADPDLGEEIKAYIVRTPDTTATPQDLVEYLSGKLARFKIPRYWEFRESLPHTPSEKVAKHELEKDREHPLVNTVDVKRESASR